MKTRDGEEEEEEKYRWVRGGGARRKALMMMMMMSPVSLDCLSREAAPVEEKRHEQSGAAESDGHEAPVSPFVS